MSAASRRTKIAPSEQDDEDRNSPQGDTVVQLSLSSCSPTPTDPSKWESLPTSRHPTPSFKTEIVQDYTGTYDKQLEDDTLGLEKRIKRVRVKPEEVIAEPQLWLDAPSAKVSAAAEFSEISQCIYQSKDMGESGQEEIMSCDCKPEFGILRYIDFHC